MYEPEQSSHLCQLNLPIMHLKPDWHAEPEQGKGLAEPGLGCDWRHVRVELLWFGRPSPERNLILSVFHSHHQLCGEASLQAPDSAKAFLPGLVRLHRTMSAVPEISRL